MGLDMYLSATRYLSPYNEEEQRISVGVAAIIGAPANPNAKLNEFGRVQEIKMEVGYWRKSNQIHAWFVDNVQDGKDECDYFNVDREKLAELRSLCQAVLDGKRLPEEALPTRQGFFFGSTDYGEYYLQDLKYTVEIIDRALTLSDAWSLEYHSSW